MFEGRAWKITRFGEPRDALELRDVEWSDPPPGRVLIRVSGAGAGYPDVLMCRGLFPGLSEPPFGIGEEATGEVVATASGSRFSVGDRVTGITAFADGHGGYGEYAYLVERSTVAIPSHWSIEEAAGFPIAFRTAHAALIERSSVAKGKVLLVLGAAGSAGGAAIQLGKALGAEVVAVAGDEEKMAFCLAHGADHALNYHSSDISKDVRAITSGVGADLVFDPVGGPLAANALQALGRYGQMLIVGLASGGTVELDSTDLLLRNISAVGVYAGGFTAEEDEHAWSRLSRLAADGQIRTPVGQVYSFDNVPAMVAGLARPLPGKTVVRLSA